MPLFNGTDDGLYRVEAEHVLDCGVVTAVTSWEHTDGAFVASSTGAFRSRDGSETWEDLDVPLGDRFWHAGESEVWSILATALLLVANLGILFWKYPRASAGALIVFFIGATPAIHSFCTMEGTERQNNKINFLKNVALLGGAVVLLREASERRG